MPTVICRRPNLNGGCTKTDIIVQHSVPKGNPAGLCNGDALCSQCTRNNTVFILFALFFISFFYFYFF